MMEVRGEARISFYNKSLFQVNIFEYNCALFNNSISMHDLYEVKVPM